MYRILTIVFALITICAFGQKAPAEKALPIIKEGKLLYESEMASWYGTDLFMASYSDRENIGGYFSYTVNDTSKCVFFSKSDTPEVIGTISFDSTYNTGTAKVDLDERKFTGAEMELYTIRKLALAEINSDTLFRTYNNTTLNLIPLINGNEKKVYVLTGPQQSGVVIFGNDYLLTFDRENKLTLKKPLHRNIIPMYYEDGEVEGKQIEAAMHSHLPETGDYITATDICTLMLYGKFAKWKTHHVLSQKYLNIWDCESNQLAVVPMDVVEKIRKDQERQNRKKKRAH